MKQILLSLTILIFLPLSIMAESKHVIDVDIECMSCKFCAYNIQKQLSNLPGVEKAEVNIDKNKAHVVMQNGKKADVELIKKKISDSGFTPVQVTESAH